MKRFTWLLAASLVVAACVDGSSETSTSASLPAATSPTVPTTTDSRERPTPTTSPPLSADVDRVFSGDVTMPEGFVVPAGEVWVFDPETSTSIEVSANVVVQGTLVMRPSSPEVEHTLRFVGVDEARYVGGGMDVLDSDVGLWVMGAGRLDLHGTPKPAWSYEWQPGWEGDEVLAAPIEPGDYQSFTPVAGPDGVPAPNSLGYAAELLNLTRNVHIEGTPEGRAHVLIRSSQPQQIRYAEFRYLAPLPPSSGERDRRQPGTGRYAIHFHHSGDGSRGSVLEGVVVRDAENHAFVTHASNGVTLVDTIAFNTRGAAYWWDATTRIDPGNESHDVRYERAIAAKVSHGEGGAFQLGEGTGNVVVDSVAVGFATEASNGAGYQWNGPEDGVWTFENNIAHNNAGSGIFVWVNSPTTHVIEAFTAYYNDKPGIVHGAYRNSYVYRNLTLLENDLRRAGDIAIESHAQGRPARDGGTELQLWENIVTGGAVLRTSRHAQDPLAPVRFLNCDFSAVVMSEGPGHSSLYEFIDCGLGPDDVEVVFMHPDSVMRFQNAGVAVEMDSEGTVTEIAPFHG